MDWTQIERQWAAMALRIRADAPCANLDKATAKPPIGERVARAEPEYIRTLVTVAPVAVVDPTSPTS